jgi:hypothetical protein
MDIGENAPCALPDQCGGEHAGAWILERGADFPESMTIFSLQTAMQAKAKNAALKCHTRRKKDAALSVQFYRER